MGRVLVIDDDAEIRASLKRTFEAAHHEVFLAEDGVEGVRRYQAAKPDLVFCDLNMPNQDGWETVRKLKELSREIPVVLMSCSHIAPEALRATALSLGADMFLEKPLVTQEALTMVGQILAQKRARTGRILVVDDEEGIRTILGKALRSAGHEVVLAADGLEALKCYRAAPADVVIADIFMPGMDGIETMRELRREFPDCKIIGMSGNQSARPMLSAARQLGAIAALEKPFSINQLLDAVKNAIQDGVMRPIVVS